jgi:hypothetical protein
VGIKDLFSKRAARAARAGEPDVYRYGDLPPAFRRQVVHIWQRAIGDYRPMRGGHGLGPDPTLWQTIEQTVAEEHGLFQLGEQYLDPIARCANYFLALTDVVLALDVIEAVFKAMDEQIRPNLNFAAASGVSQHPDDAIADLNQRFREHSIGYQYLGGQIVRVDSQYVHAEAVKPALHLLQDAGFEGPQDEFLRAHAHYREGKHKEAINEALKAFESTLKAILDERGWQYDRSRDTAKALLNIAFERGLIPEFLESGVGGLRSVLEAIVPTGRNRTSGHGQGSQPRPVDPHFAAYILHVTASNIVFLVECHRALGE